MQTVKCLCVHMHACMCACTSFLLSISLLDDSADNQEPQVSLTVIILDYSVYLFFTCTNCQCGNIPLNAVRVLYHSRSVVMPAFHLDIITDVHGGCHRLCFTLQVRKLMLTRVVTFMARTRPRTFMARTRPRTQVVSVLGAFFQIFHRIWLLLGILPDVENRSHCQSILGSCQLISILNLATINFDIFILFIVQKREMRKLTRDFRTPSPSEIRWLSLQYNKTVYYKFSVAMDIITCLVIS